MDREVGTECRHPPETGSRQPGVLASDCQVPGAEAGDVNEAAKRDHRAGRRIEGTQERVDLAHFVVLERVVGRCPICRGRGTGRDRGKAKIGVLSCGAGRNSTHQEQGGQKPPDYPAGLKHVDGIGACARKL